MNAHIVRGVLKFIVGGEQCNCKRILCMCGHKLQCIYFYELICTRWPVRNKWVFGFWEEMWSVKQKEFTLSSSPSPLASFIMLSLLVNINPVVTTWHCLNSSITHYSYTQVEQISIISISLCVHVGRTKENLVHLKISDILMILNQNNTLL